MGLTETKKKKVNPAKEAAKAVTKGTAASPSNSREGQSNQIRESDVAKMKAHEYERNEKAIQEAIQSGNFIYDLSKPSA